MSQFKEDWKRFKLGYNFTQLFSSPADFPMDDYNDHLKESISQSGKEITVNRVQATWEKFIEVMKSRPDAIHLSVPASGTTLVFEDEHCQPRFVNASELKSVINC